jgi:hypothetical protein
MRKLFLSAVLALLAPGVWAESYTVGTPGTIATSANSSAMTVDIPGTPAAGTVLMMPTWTRGVSATLTVTDWTEIATQTANGSLKLLCRIASGSDSDPSVDWEGVVTASGAVIIPLTGDEWTSCADIAAHSAVSGSTGTNISVPALTISTADTLVLACGRKNKTVTSDGATVTTGAQFTEITGTESSVNGTASVFACGYVQQTTATNITSETWTVSGSAENLGLNGFTVSLKTLSAAPPEFDVNPTVTAQDDNDYTLSGSTDGSVTVSFVACIKDSAAPDIAEVEAGDCDGGVNAIATATDTWNGSDSVVLTIPGTPRPLHDLYGTEGVNLITLTDEALDAPSGKQYVTLASVSGTSWCDDFNDVATPDIAAGDILKIDTTTDPSTFAWTQSTDCNGSYSGDSSRQSIQYDIYDTSVGDYMSGGPGTLWFNNQAPLPPTPPGSVRFYIPFNTPMTPQLLTGLCTDAEGDTITYSAVDPLPDELEITGGDTLEGTLTENEVFENLIWRCTDITGESVDWF